LAETLPQKTGYFEEIWPNSTILMLFCPGKTIPFQTLSRRLLPRVLPKPSGKSTLLHNMAGTFAPGALMMIRELGYSPPLFGAFMTESSLLSTQQVSDILNVSSSTVKRWVDEGRLQAVKTIGGHRKIHACDLLRVVREQHWNHVNVGPIEELLGAQNQNFSPDQTVSKFHTALTKGNQEQIRSMLLESYHSGIPVNEIGDQIICPAMNQLGQEWSRGQVEIFYEHHSTQGVLASLMEIRRHLIETIRTPENAPLAIGGGPEKDHYILANLLVELVFLQAQWRVINIGPNTPFSSFEKAVREKTPKIAWISATHLVEPETFFKEAKSFGALVTESGGELVLGGQAINSAILEDIGLPWRGSSLTDLNQHIRTLFPVGQPPRRGRPPGKSTAG
jgi:excisionase family DNA binding protein